MLKHLFSLLIGICSLLNAMAVQEPAIIAPLEGRLGQLKADSFAQVQDMDFYTDLQRSPRKFEATNLKNIISFSIDETSGLILKTPFQATLVYRLYFSFKNKPYEEDSLVENQTLVINYDTVGGKSFNAKSSFVFENAVRVRVKIVSVTTNASGWNPVPSLKLTNELQINRVYVFNCEENKVTAIHFTPPGMEDADELNVFWRAAEGADEYDLEWTYIDGSAYEAKVYGEPGSETFEENVFRNNAARVTLDNTMHYYNIPLFFDGRGWLIFRVRSVQAKPNGRRTEAHWSRYNSYEVITGHEQKLNWQAATSFAEEGKRKSVLQYFDGSLRHRQTVTKDNTEQTTVIAETLYDYQGRPVIQVLPAPTVNTLIQYTPGFNSFLNGVDYYKDNYDKILPGHDYCNGAAPAFDPQKPGAAQYYAPYNPKKQDGNNKLIPDADGFPFAETKYLQDNTGRIAAQSGVGPDHRLGSGHETKYYYGNPDQVELDALFGTEAGIASHYFKNMVRDANGQYSVSYVDMHGRTIATALAGDLPAATKLDYLPSKQDSYITKTLTDSSNNMVKGMVIESSKGLLVAKTGNHIFTYSLLPDTVNIENCNATNICYTCSYHIEITITDDCGNKQFGGKPYVFTDTVGNINTGCANIAEAFTKTFSKTLDEGSYTVTKKLTIRDEALQYYQSFFAAGNLCKTVNEFVEEQKQLFLTSTGNCATPCYNCEQQLGASQQAFIDQFIIDNGLNVNIAAHRQLAIMAYDKLYEQCRELCGNAKQQNYLAGLRTLMLQDVTPPYGQFANTLDYTENGAVKEYYANGIFGRISEGNSNYRYTIASLNYKNADGTPAMVSVLRNGNRVTLKPQQLTVDEFVNYFQSSWAETLADNLHPERMQYSILNTSPALLDDIAVGNASYDWDMDFVATETFAEALQKGYLNPTGNLRFTNVHPTAFPVNNTNNDPFIIWHPTYRTQMHAFMQQVASGGGYSADIWSAASISGFCSGQDDLSCMQKQISDPFSMQGCTADLDMAWRAFRAMYKAKKDELILAMVKSNTANAPVIDVNAYQSHFTDNRTAINSGTGIHDINSKADVTAALQDFYQGGNSCAGYAELWWQKLMPCDIRKLLPYKTQLLADLVTVCNKGTDENHMMGASSIAPGNTNAYQNFDEVLAHYVQQYNTANPGTPIGVLDCNGSLLNFPAPYATPRVLAGKPVISKPDSCECEKITELHNDYANDNTPGDFSAYLQRILHTTISNGALDSLLGLCHGTVDCKFISNPIILPPVLQCGTENSCVPCAAVKEGYDAFTQLYPGIVPLIEESNSGQQKANALFGHFMNRRFGFTKLTQEYLAFMDSCGAVYRNAERDSLQALMKRFNKDVNPYRVEAYCQSNALNPNTIKDLNEIVSDGYLHWPKAIRDTTGRIWVYFQHRRSGGHFCLDNGYAIEYRVKSLKNVLRAGDDVIYFTDANSGFVLYKRETGQAGFYLRSLDGKSNLILMDNDPNIIFKEWITIKIKITTTAVSFYYNNKLINEVLRDSIPLKNWPAFTLAFFDYQGAVDWVRMYDANDKQVYFDDFNSTDTRSTVTSSFICAATATDCQTPFVKYYNQQKGTNYTYRQIDSVYTASKLVLDVCGLDTANVNCNQLENYAELYKNEFIHPASRYVDLDMRTFAGNKTPDEGPKGVFDVKGNLLGNTIDSTPTAIKQSYVQIWNSSPDNRQTGTLSLLQNGQFRLTLNAYKQPPKQGIIGQRYYQFEVLTDTLDAVRTGIHCYIDFGDGTRVKIDTSHADSLTSVYGGSYNTSYGSTTQALHGITVVRSYYVIHRFLIPGTKTVTVYHPDIKGAFGFDNFFPSAYGLTKLKHLRGYMPQETRLFGFHSTQDSTLNTTINIRNFRQVNSIEYIGLENGSVSPNTRFKNNRFESFANNKGLRGFWISDQTRRPLEEYLPDWKNNFKKLSSVLFSDADALYTSNIDFSLPDMLVVSIGGTLSSAKVDTIINQVASATICKSGILQFSGTGATRTSASDAAVAVLSGKLWRLTGAGMNVLNTSIGEPHQVDPDSVLFTSSFTDFINNKLRTTLTYNQVNSLYLAKCGHLPDLDAESSNSQSSVLLLCGKNNVTAIPVESRKEEPCADSLNFAISRGYQRYAVYSDSVRGEFAKAFISKCLTAAQQERFTVKQAVSEYHYTLYYYDQAGNLVKTAPPNGVKPNFDEGWLQGVSDARKNNSTVVPLHEQVTQYRYNTLNQVVHQQSPDAGAGYFWYDRLGRLAVSQNAKQSIAGAEGPGVRYSYTIYDQLSRITETGQISNASGTMSNATSRNPAQLQRWMNTNASRKRQVTATFYDQSAKESDLHKDLAPYIFRQSHLRNRVSFTVFSKSGHPAIYDYAAFYHYDIHGNVDTLLQDYGETGVLAQHGNRYKRIACQYDLVSGKVNAVSYQPRLYDAATQKFIAQPDAFYHQYRYDGENRLTDVFTSANEVHWEHEAHYSYYKHGPLSRVIIGENQVQAMDYAYTLQGWLKAINNTGVEDGLVARDAYGFSLHYYGNDYKAINAPHAYSGVTTKLQSVNAYKPLYNGNVSSMAVHIGKLNNPVLYNYQYDQLNRITGMDMYKGNSTGNNLWDNGLTATQEYKERISYDANGNIITYNRNGFGSAIAMDNLQYYYLPGSNKLDHVTDQVAATNYTEDIDDQQPGNYEYDAIGNMIKDNAEGISNISWTVYGKMESITKTNGQTITYDYDASGNRISKKLTASGRNTTTTLYIRDATGNIMAVYSIKSADNKLFLSEQQLYGSSRLGTYNPDKDLSQSPPPVVNMGSGNIGSLVIFERGRKFFELGNHLGNVLVTVSDRKTGIDENNDGIVDYYTADVSSAQDYYPFGMQMPGRKFDSGKYRYGFNGKENDNEVKGDANQQDYGMRIYDTRLGKFLSVDPLTKSYAFYSPYQFAGNSPIENSDLDGLEAISETKAAQMRQYEMAIRTRAAVQNAQERRMSTFTNGSQAPVSPPNFAIASAPDYIYRADEKYRAELMWQNYLRSNGYHEDATPTAATRLMQNKTWNKFADNIALPTLEIASLLDGAAEIKTALKYTSSLLKAAFKTSKNIGGILDGINATVEGITARRVLIGDPEKIAVIGRDMDRVSDFAQGIGGEIWTGFNPLLSETQNVANNAKWAKEIKDKGYTVFDIGLDDASIFKYDGIKGKYYDVETKIIFGDK